MGIIANTSQEKVARQSIRALLEHIEKSSQEQQDKKNKDAAVIINLSVTTDKPMVKKSDHVPIIIKLPHKFGSVRNRRMLLITKDPVIPYRKQLERPDCDTENLFKGVYGLKKLKTRMTNARYAKQVYGEYDTIMADHRVHHKLRDVLGARFYQKNRKVPFMLQMDLPENLEKARVAAKKNSTKGNNVKKEEEEIACSPEYVYRQVKAIIRNTHVVFSDSGNTASIRVGTSDMDERVLLENIEAVLQFLTEEKFKTSGGGVLRQGANWLRNCHVKSNDSTSLPVYVETEGMGSSSGVVANY